MRALRPFALEAFFSKWEFTARHHLCASDMQSMKLSELLAMADADNPSGLGCSLSWLHRDVGLA